jgi:capsular polysaccharide biosynthesis protein
MPSDSNIICYLVGIITGVFGLIVIAIASDYLDKRK